MTATDAARGATADTTPVIAPPSEPSDTSRPPAPGPGEPPPLRASDADRWATVVVLQDAVAAGCLTPAEGSDRMGTAFAAVHRRDLDPLVADLPPSPAPPAGERQAESLRRRFAAADPRWRLAVLVALGLLLLLVVGSLAAELYAGGRGGFGGRPGGFGPGPDGPRFR